MSLILIGQPKHRFGVIQLKPQKPSGIIEGRLRRQIDAEIRIMIAEIQPIANSDEKGKYEKLWFALNKWQKRFEKLGQAEGSELFERTFDKNKKQLIAQLTDKLSVNVDVMWDSKKFADTMTASIESSTALIKSIPEQYIGQISHALLLETQRLPQPEGRSLWQQIQHISGVTKERAIFIARDQTSKVNAAIAEYQADEAESPYYIWKTSKDSRVVGNPSGLYPKGSALHGDHYHREGKKYFWKTPTVTMRKKYPDVNPPPKDGNASFPIQCRCWSLACFDREKIS